MRALDPLLHEEETELNLEKLTQVDSYRQGYYKDLSKYTNTNTNLMGFHNCLLACLIDWLNVWLID